MITSEHNNLPIYYFEKKDKLLLSNHNRNIMKRAEELITELFNRYIGEFELNPKEKLVIFFYKPSVPKQAVGFYCKQKGYIYICINTVFLFAFKNRVFNDTIPHEVAHAIQFEIYPNSEHHGTEFFDVLHYMKKDELNKYFNMTLEDNATIAAQFPKY